jgi:hypothetical protein
LNELHAASNVRQKFSEIQRLSGYGIALLMKKVKFATTKKLANTGATILSMLMWRKSENDG